MSPLLIAAGLGAGAFAGCGVPSFISEDGCRLYFDRTPNAWSSPNGNVYVAEREAIDE